MIHVPCSHNQSLKLMNGVRIIILHLFKFEIITRASFSLVSFELTCDLLFRFQRTALVTGYQIGQIQNEGRSPGCHMPPSPPTQNSPPQETFSTRPSGNERTRGMWPRWAARSAVFGLEDLGRKEEEKNSGYVAVNGPLQVWNSFSQQCKTRREAMTHSVVWVATGVCKNIYNFNWI